MSNLSIGVLRRRMVRVTRRNGAGETSPAGAIIGALPTRGGDVTLNGKPAEFERARLQESLAL
ncbi:MAG: hypothetical protein HYX53_04045 [Chloroflexi bacterium]|nr:hypothetical protein [Chloroflexota bacterium]